MMKSQAWTLLPPTVGIEVLYETPIFLIGSKNGVCNLWACTKSTRHARGHILHPQHRKILELAKSII